MEDAKTTEETPETIDPTARKLAANDAALQDAYKVRAQLSYELGENVYITREWQHKVDESERKNDNLLNRIHDADNKVKALHREKERLEKGIPEGGTN